MLATAAYTAIVTWVILKIVGVITELRASEEEEVNGLDRSDHEEEGYKL
ncbi:MAG: hypothetical protein OIF34_08745 [Porticoccaceae bacterium]|nr:hypothetical protein [Porticoccaceae bacterium]